MINKPPPLNRDDNKDPNIKALKRRGFINHGSTLLQPKPQTPNISPESPDLETHHESYSLHKLLISPVRTPTTLPYRIPYINPPLREFRPQYIYYSMTGH